jgi:hypothetical protein
MFTPSVDRTDRHVVSRQLRNKHAKNYQNAEKITKFLLSNKMVWKSIKHISKALSITEAMFSQFFFLICTVDWICTKCEYGAAMIEPGPRNQHRVNGDQQDSVDSAGQLGPAACNLDVKLCRHSGVTTMGSDRANPGAPTPMGQMGAPRLRL